VSSTTARWVPVTTLALAVVGLGTSTYLAYERYSSSSTLACPENGSVNCLKVTSSSYSTLAGIPVALLGLLFFLAITPLCLPAAWRTGQPWVSRARVGAVSIGMVFVLYLVWAELFRIDAICLWCTAVHAVTLALFAVVVIAAALQPEDARSPAGRT
jgi:uncharacterized membrane protein